MIYGLHYFKRYERKNVGEHVRKEEPSGRWPEKWRQFSLKLLDRGEKNQQGKAFQHGLSRIARQEIARKRKGTVCMQLPSKAKDHFQSHFLSNAW